MCTCALCMIPRCAGSDTMFLRAYGRFLPPRPLTLSCLAGPMVMVYQGSGQCYAERISHEVRGTRYSRAVRKYSSAYLYEALLLNRGMFWTHHDDTVLMPCSLHRAYCGVVFKVSCCALRHRPVLQKAIMRRFFVYHRFGLVPEKSSRPYMKRRFCVLSSRISALFRPES